MVVCMATRKFTITLQDDQLQEIRALVATGQAANVSAFVQHAVGLGPMLQAGERCYRRRSNRPAARSPRRSGIGPTRFSCPRAAQAVVASDPDDLRRLDASLELIAI